MKQDEIRGNPLHSIAHIPSFMQIIYPALLIEIFLLLIIDISSFCLHITWYRTTMVLMILLTGWQMHLLCLSYCKQT